MQLKFYTSNRRIFIFIGFLNILIFLGLNITRFFLRIIQKTKMRICNNILKETHKKSTKNQNDYFLS